MWVPGQDLATPHLMRNCGKPFLSLHCALYGTDMCNIGVFACPVLCDMSMHDSKQCPGMVGPAGAYGLVWSILPVSVLNVSYK